MKRELLEIRFGDVRDTVIKQYYSNNENCRVIVNPDVSGNLCILFISSNSIYYPNTENAVEVSLNVKDKYEWTNLAQMEPLKSRVSKFVFIRDVYKQWYISGINDTVDSIEKLIELLMDLTKGYRLIIIGNSSGGYLASLLASKMDVDRVFSISGQWDIRDQAQKAPFVEAEISAGYEYLDITNLHNEKNSMIYYLYPALCKWDQEQSKLVRNKSGIIHIPFKQDLHGATCFGFNLPLLFLMDDKKLLELSENAPMGGWKRTNFLFKSVGVLKGLHLLIQYYVHKIKK